MTDHDAGLLVRIQGLEDLEAIRRTWHDYMISLDSRAWEDLADVFTDDGVVEMIVLDFLFEGGDGVYPGGGEAIVRDFYNSLPRDERSPTANRNTGHNGSNMIIDLDGD